jgi:hypothetical protein
MSLHSVSWAAGPISRLTSSSRRKRSARDACRPRTGAGFARSAKAGSSWAAHFRASPASRWSGNAMNRVVPWRPRLILRVGTRWLRWTNKHSAPSAGPFLGPLRSFPSALASEAISGYSPPLGSQLPGDLTTSSRAIRSRLERWQSGRSRRTRNAEYGQPYRGFESLPLRQPLFRRRPPSFALVPKTPVTIDIVCDFLGGVVQCRSEPFA